MPHQGSMTHRRSLLLCIEEHDCHDYDKKWARVTSPVDLIWADTKLYLAKDLNRLCCQKSRHKFTRRNSNPYAPLWTRNPSRRRHYLQPYILSYKLIRQARGTIDPQEHLSSRRPNDWWDSLTAYGSVEPRLYTALICDFCWVCENCGSFSGKLLLWCIWRGGMRDPESWWGWPFSLLEHGYWTNSLPKYCNPSTLGLFCFEYVS